MLVDLAQDLGRADDANLRQDLMRLYTLNEIARYTNLRAKAAKAAGRAPGPEGNTAKLVHEPHHPAAAATWAWPSWGPAACSSATDAPLGGMLAEMALFAPAVSIYGGSDEIQKNIIGERVLGLPSEPRPDKGVPFKDLKVGTQAG